MISVHFWELIPRKSQEVYVSPSAGEKLGVRESELIFLYGKLTELFASSGNSHVLSFSTLTKANLILIHAYMCDEHTHTHTLSQSCARVTFMFSSTLCAFVAVWSGPISVFLSSVLV